MTAAAGPVLPVCREQTESPGPERPVSGCRALARDQALPSGPNTVTCKAGSRVALYRSGRLRFCRLARGQTLTSGGVGTACRAGKEVRLHEDGNLFVCALARAQPVATKSGERFDCRAGVRVFFDKDGSIDTRRFHGRGCTRL